MKTNPFYDTWLFFLGATPDHDESGVKYLLVILFPLLLIAGSVIAWRNWQADPLQRTSTHLATWAMRTLIGCMWFQGSLWKLPLPVSSGLKFWTSEMAKHAAFDVHKALVSNIILPALPVLNTLVYLLELGLAASFILGFLVRPFAALGMLFVVQLWFGLYQHPGEWPWTYIFLIFTQGMFLLHHAGRSLGLDATIARAPSGIFAGDHPVAQLYRKAA
jgi:uncharacterized membrane protein YphA (DoxX/SURF4 family)